MMTSWSPRGSARSPRAPPWCHGAPRATLPLLPVRCGALVPPAVGDRQPAVAPERAQRDLGTGWVLPSLVLGRVGQAEHLLDQLAVEAGGDQVRDAAVELHVVVQDLVEDVVGRQGVAVELPWPQLGRRFLR